jgi:hypothetical protein
MLLSKFVLIYFRQLKETDLCHIYPFYLLRKDTDLNGPRNTLWGGLSLFWSQDKVQRWRDEIFPHGNENGSESAINLISLNHTCHVLWNAGAFALKPILVSADQKVLTLEFWWQKKMQAGQSMSLTTRPWATHGLDRGSDGDRIVKDSEPHLIRITSGYRFTIETDNPDLRLLPSFQLLNL